MKDKFTRRKYLRKNSLPYQSDFDWYRIECSERGRLRKKERKKETNKQTNEYAWETESKKTTKKLKGQ